MNGIELQARYSYEPCSIGYCGTETFPAIFRGYLKGNVDLETLKKEIDKFTVPTAYRNLIAKYNRVDPYSIDVVQALWVGNKLLDNVPESALKNFIKTDLVNSGLNKIRAEKLAKNMPPGVSVHHSFHTMYIQFVSDEVPRTLDSFDKCRIGWGKVLSQNKDYIGLDFVSVLFVDGKYLLGKTNKKVKSGFLSDVKIGDVISTHWDSAVVVIDDNQVKNLEKYTQKTLDAINSI